MTSINILKFGASSSADTTPLKELKAAGYDAKNIISVVGKSEGANISHFWAPSLIIQEMAVSMTSRELLALMFGSHSSQSRRSQYFPVAQRESSVPM